MTVLGMIIGPRGYDREFCSSHPPPPFLSIQMYSNSDTMSEEISGEVENTSATATSDPSTSDPSTEDSPSHLPTDLLPLSPKRPRIAHLEKSAVNTDVADMVKRRNALTDEDKYQFYCNHFSPDIDFKFPREKSRSFQH